jgi:hypothetical protein
MSSALTPPAPAPAGIPASRREITLVSHSMLFYWWPVWVFGYLFALITFIDNDRLAIVPDKTTMKVVEARSDEKNTVYEVTVPNPPTKSLELAERATRVQSEGDTFKTRVSPRPWLGPVFLTLLLLTVVITTVPLRGLWSFLVILLLLILVLGISMVQGGWDHLLGAIGNLHIYINMAGYLFIATAVLILWAVSVFIFDKRTYMRITPGQVQVCEHIGASIRNFDTTGMSFEKQRDDLFRHWLLGFFSGDLIVRTAGAEKETIRLPNVLWISWRLEEVQQLLREKATVVHT